MRRIRRLVKPIGVTATRQAVNHMIQSGAQEGLREAFYRFGLGDWLRNTRTGRIVGVVSRTHVIDALTGSPEVAYDVEDLLTGEMSHAGNSELEGPLNEMEVLAWVSV